MAIGKIVLPVLPMIQILMSVVVIKSKFQEDAPGNIQNILYVDVVCIDARVVLMAPILASVLFMQTSWRLQIDPLTK